MHTAAELLWCAIDSLFSAVSSQQQDCSKVPVHMRCSKLVAQDRGIVLKLQVHVLGRLERLNA